MSKNDSVTLKIRQLFIYLLQIYVEENGSETQNVGKDLRVQLSAAHF